MQHRIVAVLTFILIALVFAAYRFTTSFNSALGDSPTTKYIVIPSRGMHLPQFAQGTIPSHMYPPFALPSSSASAVKLPPINKISQIPNLMSKRKGSVFPRFHNLYVAEEKAAVLKVPEAFAPRVKSMFSSYPGGTESLDFVENQKIITTYNKYTDEYSLFNEVRRYRPGYMEKLSSEKEEELHKLFHANEGPDTCDFCAKTRTAQDVFGRIEGKHCYTGSNVAKYESWHGLLISNTHSPLDVTAERLIDYLQVAHKWFEKAHALDSEAVFPHLMWDAGPRASASQVHQHLQMSLTHDRYFSRAENTRRAAIAYETQFEGRNYWTDVLAVHEQLDLAVKHGEAMLISHLCPIKERELIIVAETSRTDAFAELLAVAIKTLTEDVGTRAFSLAMTLHPLAIPPRPATDDMEQESFFSRGGDYNAELQKRLLTNYPTIVRIVDRGNPLDARSDVGAMEFFGANNVGADPYHIMPALKRRVAELQQQKKE